MSRPDYRADEATGCWMWLKSTTKRGYPSRREHRDYYERVHGPIPVDHDVHHKCRNTGCVNPAHLEALHKLEHTRQHTLEEWAGLTLEQVAEIRELGRQPGVRAEEVAGPVRHPLEHRQPLLARRGMGVLPRRRRALSPDPGVRVLRRGHRRDEAAARALLQAAVPTEGRGTSAAGWHSRS